MPAVLFLRLLAVVYFNAFAGLLPQLDGLFGSTGIAPVEHFFLLVILTLSGVVLSILLFLAIAEPLVLFLLYFFYLLVVSMGQEFLCYQWDMLLLETGFISIFLGRSRYFSFSERIQKVALIAIAWLNFRLFFSSGFVKIISEAVDSSWLNLTALSYHFETQPLPNPVAFLLNSEPLVFSKINCAVALVIELLVPFLIFAGRKARTLAALLLIGLQAAIAISGNYGFFNLLSVALAVTLLPSDIVATLLTKCKISGWLETLTTKQFSQGNKQILFAKIIAYPAMFLIAFSSSVSMALTLQPELVYKLSPVIAYYGLLQNFAISSTYGLFAVMTRERPELIIEGSEDGINYQPYEFNYKVGDLKCAPPVVLYMPRLDWQLWFEALNARSGRKPDRWFVHFLSCLARGDESVMKLLKHCPMSKPKYLRVRLFDYKFTSPQVLFSNGNWWRRTEIGTYLQTK